MKVYLSELAESKLLTLNEYLLSHWNMKVKNDFFQKFRNKVKLISNQPKSCPESSEFKGLYKCVVSKHNTFYYRINQNQNEIEIITIFDTRQSPDKLQVDLNNKN